MIQKQEHGQHWRLWEIKRRERPTRMSGCFFLQQGVMECDSNENVWRALGSLAKTLERI